MLFESLKTPLLVFEVLCNLLGFVFVRVEVENKENTSIDLNEVNLQLSLAVSPGEQLWRSLL